MLAVFGVVYLLLQRKASKEKTSKRPYAGFILMAAVTVGVLPVIDDIVRRISFMVAVILIALVGRADEIKPLTAKAQFIWQLVIVLILVTWGWTIPYVSQPLGEGIMRLDWVAIGPWIIPGSVIAAIWLLMFVNAINWLDGVDGLAASVLTVAFLALAAITALPSIQDTETLIMSLVGLGAIAAFLIWNFPPARVYLGTVGSWFMGLYIAMVAMNGGGKIATTLLILALPVLDMALVIMRRLLQGRLPWQGDRINHLHYRLLAAGVTAKNISLAAAALTASLAVLSILVPTAAKLGITALLACGFIFAFLRVLFRQESAHN